MKRIALLLLFAGFTPIAKSQVTVQDSTEYSTFKQNYYAHAAYVDGFRWTTSVGNQKLGRRWQHVASEFDVSPEGRATYLLAQQQRGKAPLYLIGGYALTLGALPVLAFSSGSNLEAGVGLGMLAGGFVLNIMSTKKMAASDDNLSKALWLRNRDEMLEYVASTDQPRFKYLYDTETLYLNTRSYYKNGHKYSLGLWGTNGAEEFREIPASWRLYRNYRNSQWIGLVVEAAGFAALVFSPGPGAGNSQALYFGGLVGIGAGLGIMLSGRKSLNQAVYLRNYTVLEHQMLRQ